MATLLDRPASDLTGSDPLFRSGFAVRVTSLGGGVTVVTSELTDADDELVAKTSLQLARDGSQIQTTTIARNDEDGTYDVSIIVGGRSTDLTGYWDPNRVGKDGKPDPGIVLASLDAVDGLESLNDPGIVAALQAPRARPRLRRSQRRCDRAASECRRCQPARGLRPGGEFTRRRRPNRLVCQRRRQELRRCL